MCYVHNFTIEQDLVGRLLSIDAEPLWPLECKLGVPCSIAHNTTSDE